MHSLENQHQNQALNLNLKLKSMSNVNLNQHVLSVLAKCNHLNHLKQLQAFLIALGHSQTQFYAFKLVRFCALSLANLPYARFIFDHLHSPNAYLYTAMITAYASHHHHSTFSEEEEEEGPPWSHL
ncbi:hypothetical protein ACB098_12G001200 [Castanea mollissima]